MRLSQSDPVWSTHPRFGGEHRLSAYVYGALTDHAYPLNSPRPERLLSFSSAPSLPILNPSSLIQNSRREAYDWAAAVTVATALKSIVGYILGSVYAALMLFGFLGGCVIKTTLTKRRRREGKLGWRCRETMLLPFFPRPHPPHPRSLFLRAGIIYRKSVEMWASCHSRSGAGGCMEGGGSVLLVSGLHFVSITEVISINQWVCTQIMGRKWHKLPCASSISNGFVEIRFFYPCRTCSCSRAMSAVSRLLYQAVSVVTLKSQGTGWLIRVLLQKHVVFG